MTNLSQAPYGLMAAFFGDVFNEMNRQGVTVEHIEALRAAPDHLHRWIERLPTITPSTGDTAIAELFPDDSRLVNLLLREEITTLTELTDCTAEEVQRIWQLGPDTFTKIVATLEARGLRFSEDIKNGARRIAYSSPDDKRTVRLDRIGGKRLSDFIPIERTGRLHQRERESMTIDQFRTATSDTHRRLFSDNEIDRISNWIIANVH